MTERERHLLCSERFYRLLFTEDRGGVADPKDTRSFIKKIRNQYRLSES